MDFVIAWVDGTDPAWQAELARFGGDGDTARYRDWGLLPYWFRAVEAFAPWVERIHFLTWGHVPDWLDLAHPKLHVVNHRDFIPEKYLPAFSSHVIEMNLHRIPGLSEEFVYFNDDMFLLRRVKEADFLREGLPCACGCEVPWVFSGEVGVWAHAAANGLGVINRHFPKKDAVKAYGHRFLSRRWQDALRTLGLEILFPDAFTGFRNLHGPAAFRKQTFAQVWAAEPKLLERTCSHRFRDAGDVNQWVFLWWQVASGMFCHREMDNLVLCPSDGAIFRLRDAIENQRHDFICIQDPGGDVESWAQQLRVSFEQLLPNKSGFEL